MKNITSDVKHRPKLTSGVVTLGNRSNPSGNLLKILKSLGRTGSPSALDITVIVQDEIIRGVFLVLSKNTNNIVKCIDPLRVLEGGPRASPGQWHVSEER